MKTVRRVLLCFFVVFTISGCTTPPTSDLLSQLTDLGMAGRMVGTEGNADASRLLANEMAVMKLEPLPGYADFMIPYEQDLLVYDEEELQLIALQPDGTRDALVPGKDFRIHPFIGVRDGTFALISSLKEVQPDKNAVYLYDDKRDANVLISDLTNQYAAVIKMETVPAYNSYGYNRKGSFFPPPSDACVIVVAPEAYTRLLEAEAVELSVAMEDAPMTANNVVGVIPGKDRTRAVVLSAHFDGAGDQWGATMPCALDNASGVACMMQVAELLLQPQPETDIVLCAINGEEAGLSGVDALVPLLQTSYETLYNINIDCVGLPDMAYAMGNGYSDSAPLYDTMIAHLREKGANVDEETIGAGDQWAFQQQGIPAVILEDTASMQHRVHTPEDKPDAIDRNELATLANWVADFVRQSGAEMYSPVSSAITEPDAHDPNDVFIMPSLAYDEYQKVGDRLVQGSSRMMLHSEMLEYFPDMPLPLTFMGASLEACRIQLHPPRDTDELEEGVVMKTPIEPGGIWIVDAIYSDGSTTYRLNVWPFLNDLTYLITPVNSSADQYTVADPETQEVIGAGQPLGKFYYELTKRVSSDELVEIEPEVYVHFSRPPEGGLSPDEVELLLHNQEFLDFMEAMDAWMNTPGK